MILIRYEVKLCKEVYNGLQSEGNVPNNTQFTQIIKGDTEKSC